jgi:hypothetical protein
MREATTALPTPNHAIVFHICYSILLEKVNYLHTTSVAVNNASTSALHNIGTSSSFHTSPVSAFISLFVIFCAYSFAILPSNDLCKLKECILKLLVFCSEQVVLCFQSSIAFF